MDLYDDWRFLNLSDESNFEGAANGKNPVWQQITLAWARLADEGKFNCTLCDTRLSIAEGEEGPNFPLLVGVRAKASEEGDSVDARYVNVCEGCMEKIGNFGEVAKQAVAIAEADSAPAAKH
jgi:hypothetical protein